MRTLAIDFGEVRVGLALSDPTGRIAMPLDTLDRRSDQQLIERILALIDAESVERLVIGDPVRLDGTPGTAARRVRSFATKLQSAAGIVVRLRPETLTSVAAKERLREAGVDLRKATGRIDAVAAQILLEEELASREPPTIPTADTAAAAAAQAASDAREERPDGSGTLSSGTPASGTPASGTPASGTLSEEQPLRRVENSRSPDR